MKLLFSFLLLGAMAMGQTTVTGTIIDPNGNSYANGTASAYTVATSGQPTTSTSPVATNSSGFFTLSLNANTYIFTICAPPVKLGPTTNPTPTQICFTSSPIAISGPSQDVSTALNSLSVVLGPNRVVAGGSAVTPIIKASAQGGVTADAQISNAIAALSGGTGTVWADYSTNQTWSACPIWGTGNVNLLLYAVTFSVSVNCTIPKNISIYHAIGSLLSPATGTLITYLGMPNAIAAPIFGNALPGQGGIDFTGNTYAFTVHPEWWGASPSASNTTNLNASQAAEYAAFGCNTSPATSCRINGSGLSGYNKRFEFCSLLNISGTITLYHVLNFVIQGCGRGTGLVQNATNARIFDGQSVAYGTIRDISLSTVATSNITLIDLDFDGSQGSDLRPQNITFHDVIVTGAAAFGVQIAKSGGGAQGDNIRCYNCYFSGFTIAAWMIGNANGSGCLTLATNGTREQIIGGDMQGNLAYGVLACGGDVDVIGTTMENNFYAQTGFDVYCASTVGTSWCSVSKVRSESRRLAGGAKIVLQDDWVQDQAGFPTPGTNCPLFPAVGSIVEGSIPGGQGIWYKCTTAGTLSGLGTPSAARTSSGGSATTEIDAAGGLTVNAWTGWRVSWISGTCINNYANITSNTATTYTFSGGIVSPFAGVAACAAPDATSTFVIEPQYGTFTTFNDGGAVLSTMGEVELATNPALGGSTAVIDNVFLPGEQLNINAASIIKSLRVTRADWIWQLGVTSGIPFSGIDKVLVITCDGCGSTFGGLFRKPIQPTFANLPTLWPDGGAALYCVDCNSTCSAGSSTGRTCFRENGAWTH